MPLTFATDHVYTDRVSKAEYVWRKYARLLRRARILDVGADECHLKRHLPHGAEYIGIGLGGRPDQQVDLERERIPFPNGSFDVVLCLDVLEHLDNIHSVFDELCRVTRGHVIISLPNPWADFYHMLRVGEYRPGQATKFYGLPPDPPEDRHKWFFSTEEAERFIRYRASKNAMDVVQIDREPGYRPERNGWERVARRILIRPSIAASSLHTGTLWGVLGRISVGDPYRER